MGQFNFPRRRRANSFVDGRLHFAHPSCPRHRKTMYPQPTEIWLVITHLGAASIMLPMFMMITAELWLAKQKSNLLTWLLAMMVGVAIVLASKIVFIGWGWGSASLNFIGISGHTMLASSIFPVWMGWLLAGPTRRFSLHGVILGLAIGAVVGWSRLILGRTQPE